MEIKLKSGTGYQTCHVSENHLLGILHPKKIEHHSDATEIIRMALEHPIGSRRLSELVSPEQKIVIITSDITRPVPSSVILPEVLLELKQAHIPDANITIVFAIGSHRHHTEAERRQIVGDDIYEHYQCIDHDPDDCIHMGTTPGGTPVDIFRAVADADFRICIGNIEFHYFAGYSGGYKAIMPGVSTRAAIQANHSKMVLSGAYAGYLENNPVRRDIEAAAAFCPAHFIVNVVLNDFKEIIHCVCGHYIKAHRAGCRYVDHLYKMPISEKADIVIVSAGGFPKDINMYQAQKALDNAKYAVRPGGIIIWVADCTEGFGEQTFEQWILSQSEEPLIDRIRREFKLGGHKAAAISMVLSQNPIILVSRLSDDIVRKAHLIPGPDINSALDTARSILGKDSRILIMPNGGSTLPRLVRSENPAVNQPVSQRTAPEKETVSKDL